MLIGMRLIKLVIAISMVILLRRCWKYWIRSRIILLMFVVFPTIQLGVLSLVDTDTDFLSFSLSFCRTIISMSPSISVKSCLYVHPTPSKQSPLPCWTAVKSFNSQVRNQPILSPSILFFLKLMLIKLLRIHIRRKNAHSSTIPTPQTTRSKWAFSRSFCDY